MKNYLDNIFNKITENLDLSESQENVIVKAYNAVADWFNRNDSELKKYNIEIFPQGSMSLGTVVKPIANDDYDIDMVCLFNKEHENLSPYIVKNIIGNRLRANEVYKKMLQKEGKRCWTLQYSDSLNFHMDILPSVPRQYNNGMWATIKHNNEYSFFPTNPKAFREWFVGQMNINITSYTRGDIESVPEYKNKKPLQKVIQILKRHRDVMYATNPDVAPASIIITAIIAKLYNGEQSIVEILDNILPRFKDEIRCKNGVYYVDNPVDSTENFAERWKGHPDRAREFFRWLDKINSDYNDLISIDNNQTLLIKLYEMFGQQAVDLANNSLGGFDKIVPKNLKGEMISYPPEIRTALNARHRQRPPWKLPMWHTAKIEGYISANGTNTRFESGTSLRKGVNIFFKAVYNTSESYVVKWQVTNTGKDAIDDDGLRGGFYNSESYDKNVRKEYTRYSGIHYVQCFIISKGKCIAQSKEFIVEVV